MKRWVIRAIWALALLSILAIGAGWWAMRGSLALLDGQLALAGLTAPVELSRDAAGVLSVQAQNETDAMRALGFAHAQERFFEMDLLRRSAAGELSALFGKIALERDKKARVHRLRARVDAEWEDIEGSRNATLEAYRDGVNAGLAALRTRPWPYLLLNAQPEPWRVGDTALAADAMFFDLQDEGNVRELALWRMRRVLPETLYRLITAPGSDWDAPMLGAAFGDPPLPDAAALDLRKLPTPTDDTPLRVLEAHPLTFNADADSRACGNCEPLLPGSNNFAVNGSRTGDGRAIVANDMHLGLRAPNIWFRARLRYPDPQAPDGAVDISGFTLPGVPAVIVGSNTHIAWGFTNSYGDWLDWVRVHYADPQQTRYRTAEGEAPVREVVESIAIKGEPAFALNVRETRWGPIIERDGSDGLALRWTTHHGALNFGLADFARAGNLTQALAIARTAGVPAQNLLIVDADGHAAWQLIGRVPRRVGGCDASAPLEPLAGCDWDGWNAEPPHWIDPPGGRLWTANARVVDGDALAMIGDSGYALGARAAQIRDDLQARELIDERALRAIQLDDRALFLRRWHGLLQRLAGQYPDNADLKDLAAAAITWDLRASIDARAYPLVRAWRLAVIDRIQRGLVAPARVALGEDFEMPSLPQIEGVAYALASRQPENLLPRRFERWETLLADAAREVLDAPDSKRDWGRHNTAAICHPLAGALPRFARRLLCMPADPLPGDNHMPRVQGPSFGASERMVVSPGHEADGLIHMPGGQSGNPLSPYWGAGHAAWAQGDPTPFLPGPAEHTLTLAPGG
jgi:penicillin amidase